MLRSEDYGKHLLGVQDLLQKHTLSEADITTLTERAKSQKLLAKKFLDENHPDSDKITQKSHQLDVACQNLQSLSAKRLSHLQASNFCAMCV